MRKPRINVRTKNPTVKPADPSTGKGTQPGGGNKGQIGSRESDFGRREGKAPASPEVPFSGRKRPLVRFQEEAGGSIKWGSPYSGRRWGKGGQDNRTLSVVMSVVGAILLGTLMGVLIMNLFFSEDPDFSTQSIDSHLIQAPEGMKKPKSEVVEKKKEKKKEKPRESFRLPVLQAVLLQGGNFKERRGALETVRKYRSAGLAAVTTEESPYRIFRGVGLDERGAHQLMGILKGKDSKAYPKAVRFGDKPVSVSAVTGEKNGEKLSSWVQHGHRIFRVMGGKTAEGLKQDQKGVSLEPVWKDVINHYNNLVQTAPELEKDIPSEAKPHLARMVRGMDQVVQSGQANQKQPETSMLWQIQEGLLQYALAYEKFVEALR